MGEALAVVVAIVVGGGLLALRIWVTYRSDRERERKRRWDPPEGPSDRTPPRRRG